MRFVVDLDHLLHGNLRVDLSCRQPSVAKQLLDIAQIGTGIEEVRRKRMAQRVRRDVMDRRALFDVLVDHPSDAASRDPSSLIIQEARLHVTISLGTIAEKHAACFIEIVHQRLQRRFAEWNYSLLLSFTKHTNESRTKIDILEIDVHELTDTDPGCIKKFTHRTIATSEIGVRVGRFDKSDRVFDREMDGKLSLDPRCRDELGRIRFELSFANEKLKKRPQARELSRDRRFLFLGQNLINRIGPAVFI